MSTTQKYVATHPSSIVTSVALSDGHRVFMGREIELTDEQKKLLGEEFDHVKVHDADKVPEEKSSEEDDDDGDGDDPAQNNPGGLL